LFSFLKRSKIKQGITKNKSKSHVKDKNKESEIIVNTFNNDYKIVNPKGKNEIDNEETKKESKNNKDDAAQRIETSEEDYSSPSAAAILDERNDVSNVKSSQQITQTTNNDNANSLIVSSGNEENQKKVAQRNNTPHDDGNGYLGLDSIGETLGTFMCIAGDKLYESYTGYGQTK